MYRNLNAESLGVSARQNELIELTLTYKFRSFDINILELVKQIGSRGREHATRYLQSANVKVGSFELPISLISDEETFASELQQLDEMASVAESLGATRSTIDLLPYCVELPYHENFELHRERIGRVAHVLAAHQIRIGLGFVAPRSAREAGDSQFIATPDALLTLIQTITADNVGLCLDTWHWHVAGGSIEQLRRLSPDKIIMVRLADLPLDADLETITSELRLLPGSTGVVPNVAWLQWLSEQNYGGPVTPYCHPAQLVGNTRAQAVGQAAEALTGLLQAAGASAGGSKPQQVASAL